MELIAGCEQVTLTITEEEVVAIENNIVLEYCIRALQMPYNNIVC